MSKKILTVGSAMRDIFIEHRAAQTLEMHTDAGAQCFVILEEGHKIEIDGVVYAIGGGATNSAVSFSRLGNTVSSFFKTGNDEAHTAIIKKLQAEGVNTSLSVQSNTNPTGTSFIIPCPSGDRSVLVHRGANKTLTQQEFPLGIFNTTDVLYCTSLTGKTASLLPLLAQYAQKHSVYVAVNPGSSQLDIETDSFLEALNFIDILILNAHEAEILFTHMVRAVSPKKDYCTPITPTEQTPDLLCANGYEHTLYFNLLHFFDLIHQTGVTTIVVTNDAEGVYASLEGSVYFHPSLDVNVTCSVGAGDAFGSCFVSYMIHGSSIQDALRAGIINAASVIQHLDTQMGLHDTIYLDQKSKSLNPSLLQIFNPHI